MMLAMLVGVFLLSAAVFFFEIVCSQIVSFVLGSGFTLTVIGIAMLGTSFAASIMSVLKQAPDGQEHSRSVPRVVQGLGSRKTLFVFCVTLAFSFLAMFYASSVCKQYSNGLGLNLRVSLDVIYFKFVPVLALVMMLPYAIFGFIVTLIFQLSEKSWFPVLYGVDLAGGALGCVFAYLCLRHGQFFWLIAVPVLLVLLAGMVFLSNLKFSLRTVTVTGLILVFAFAGLKLSYQKLEPTPNLNLLARNDSQAKKVEELWHRWGPYARVGVERTRQSPAEKGTVVVSLGNGEGLAGLAEYHQQLSKIQGGLYPAMLGFLRGVPESVLVLMAGAGSDMLALHSISQGKSRITGVELNPLVKEAAFGLPEFRLREFFSLSNVDYRIEEARSFLERDKNKYDVIMISWSGATWAYYSGIMGNTTQYVYTVEALKSMISRLTDKGHIVFVNGNKLRLLAMMRRAFDELGIGDPLSKAVVMADLALPSSSWRTVWDENILMIKPSGFLPAEIEKARMLTSTWREIVYAPGKLHPKYAHYRGLLAASDYNRYLESVEKETDLRFAVVDDDRPFIFNEFKNDRFLSLSFIRQFFVREHPRTLAHYAAFSCLLTILLSATLILGPLLLRQGVPWSASTANHLIYFSVLGSGFMFVEVGLVNRLNLLLGNPGLSISVTLAALVCFAGVGSFSSDWFFRRGFSFKWVSLSLVAYLILFLLEGHALVRFALALPIYGRVLVALGVLLPAGVLMGQLFPQGLRLCERDDRKFIPWAWAINGAAGTVATSASWFFATYFGFSILFVIGATLYATIWLLPAYRQIP